MTKKPVATAPQVEIKKITSAQKVLRETEKERSSKPFRLWPWLGALLIIGVILLATVSLVAWNWLRGLQLNANTNVPQPTITTYTVQRTAHYADLTFTILNAQYTTYFTNDNIHAGPATARINLQVANKTRIPISVIYYDSVRLLLPNGNAIAPTNLQLSPDVQAGATIQGWMDFPVDKGIKLSSLEMQFGVASLNETLVTLPFSGKYDPNLDTSRTYPLSVVFYYNFGGHVLVYHLNSIDVRYSYAGSQVHAGQQYYVLNFTVDNNNGVDVSPGYGYDYIRLTLNGTDKPPIDNTLPYGFKAGAQSVGGRVVYVAPAGMHTLTISFLVQLAPGKSSYQVSF
jgi:hypothetical protein